MDKDESAKPEPDKVPPQSADSSARSKKGKGKKGRSSGNKRDGAQKPPLEPVTIPDEKTISETTVEPDITSVESAVADSGTDSVIDSGADSGTESGTESGGVNVPAPVKARVFRLKAMVMARVLAEFTALSIMLILPLLMLLFGKFFALTPMVKLVFMAVALVAACILPIYGFITYQVKLFDDKLISYSLFKRITCDLNKINNLSRRASFNWVRFVVSFDGGELSFPTWLKNCDDLVAVVRAHLPAHMMLGGVQGFMGRRFVQDPITACVQVAQVVLSLIFMGVVWVFTLSSSTSARAATTSGQSDFALLVAFAGFASAVLLYRAWVVLLMPTSIKLNQDSVDIHTFFFKKTVARAKLKEIHPPIPLLPEGFVIKTSEGSYLVGNGMDSADELEKTLRELVPERS